MKEIKIDNQNEYNIIRERIRWVASIDASLCDIVFLSLYLNGHCSDVTMYYVCDILEQKYCVLERI